MLKERRELVRFLLFVEELCLVSAVFFLLYHFFLHVGSISFLGFLRQSQLVRRPDEFARYLQAYWVVLPLWATILYLRGDYHQLRIQTYLKIARTKLFNGLLFFALFTSAAFFLKLHFLSRAFMIAYAASSVAALMANRLIVLSVAYYVRRKGYNYRNLIVVGTGKRAEKFIELIDKHREWGFRITGLLDKDSSLVGCQVGGRPVIGTMDDLPGILEKQVVDEVVFVVPRNWLEEIERCILYCEAVGVPATLSTDFFDLEVASGVPKEMDGFTYLTFETPLLKDHELLVKRLCDVLFSVFFMIVGAPFFFSVAAAVKISSPGPVFFRQTRCGRNGRQFTLYKFRSMVAGAEQRLHELRDRNEMSGPVFKMEDDPRLTKIGKFLRKSSLDELPQLWNVFIGNMSLVGPRPPLPEEVEKYEPWQRRRLSMKPGITCIWQVSGRNNIDFEEWMKLDLQYIDRWSLWLDIKIILLTFRALLTRHGAK